MELLDEGYDKPSLTWGETWEKLILPKLVEELEEKKKKEKERKEAAGACRV